MPINSPQVSIPFSVLLEAIATKVDIKSVGNDTVRNVAPDSVRLSVSHQGYEYGCVWIQDVKPA